VDKPGDQGRLLWDMSSDELYKDPGEAVHSLPSGAAVARMEGDSLFLRGQEPASRVTGRSSTARPGHAEDPAPVPQRYRRLRQFLGFTAQPGRS
jgi:hypothetical protein